MVVSGFVKALKTIDLKKRREKEKHPLQTEGAREILKSFFFCRCPLPDSSQFVSCTVLSDFCFLVMLNRKL